MIGFFVPYRLCLSSDSHRDSGEGRERAFSICYSTVAATNWGEMTNEEQNAG